MFEYSFNKQILQTGYWGVSLLPGSDVIFLWLQLPEKTFSFKRIYKLHSSDLKVFGTDWLLSEPSLWPKFTISKMQPEKPEYYLLSRTHICIPILYSYVYTLYERRLSMWKICLYLDSLYICIYTHIYMHICQ